MSDRLSPPSTPDPSSREGHDHDHTHAPHAHGDEPPLGPRDPHSDQSGDSGTQALAEALKRSFAILKLVMLALIVVFLFSGLRIVGPEERGVILRLGKPVGEGEGILLPPGPRWAWPNPIDEFVKIPINRLQEVASTVGWYQTSAAAEALKQEEPFGPALRPVQDGYTLTGDANIVHVRSSFSYRITEPAQYLFAFENTPILLTNALNNAIHFASSQFAVEDLLKGGLAAFKDKVRERLATLVQQQRLGVSVDTLNVLIIPPRQVKEFFDQVLAESTKAEAAKNAARSEADRILKDASSAAIGIVFAAKSESETEIKRLQEEAKRFGLLQSTFEKSPELLKDRELSELIQRISPLLLKKLWFLDSTDGQKTELRLLFNGEEKPPVASPTPPAPAADQH